MAYARKAWILDVLIVDADAVCLVAGPVYKYDLSVPVGEMYSLVEDMRKRVEGHEDVQARSSAWLGHLATLLSV